MKTKFLILLAILAIALVATPVLADTETIWFNDPNTALTGYPNPFAKLVIDVPSDGVTAVPAEFTLTALHTGSYYYGLTPTTGLLGLSIPTSETVPTGTDGLTINTSSFAYDKYCATDPLITFTVTYQTSTTSPLTNVDGAGAYAININSTGNASMPINNLYFTSNEDFLSAAVVLALFNPTTDPNSKGNIAACEIGASVTPISCTSSFAATGGVWATPEDYDVPIPPSAILLGSGLIGLVGLGYRRRKS